MNLVGFVITRNNAGLLEKSISKIPNCINTIFISDDNSQDNPEHIAKKLNIPIYKNKECPKILKWNAQTLVSVVL